LVQADEVRVEQALSNLLSNARKYSPAGGTIRLAAVQRGGFVEVSVADEGLGIPRQALGRVFEKFYRVDSEDRRGIRGTGLGLAVVRELVQAQGGQIGVESEGAGKGTRFWFTLPVATAAARPASELTPAGEPVKAPEPAPAPTPAGRMRILAVDDEPAIGNMLRRLLRADGHVLDYAGSAAEALDRLAADPYDVVVSDLGLGEGADGLSLAEQVRQQWPGVRFILASGSVDIDADQARARGVHAFLSKPYQVDDLRGVLRSAA
jgi:CheY-like chemotaxis protein/anti-sigma regulatory factor (Ser/Thr protein kinase)